MHLHEPSLLYNIRFRYAKNLIYTYTGARAQPPVSPIHLGPDPTAEHAAQATS